MSRAVPITIHICISGKKKSPKDNASEISEEPPAFGSYSIIYALFDNSGHLGWTLLSKPK